MLSDEVNKSPEPAGEVGERSASWLPLFSLVLLPRIGGQIIIKNLEYHLNHQ